MGYLCFPLIVVMIFSACRKGEYALDQSNVVIRDNGSGTGTVTWTNDRSYMLEGKVFVNDGQVLSIEPGTVIRSRTGQGNASSALIVARGGKIIAKGSPEAPIIFTSEGDDLEGSVPLLTRGLWGGLVILGNAQLNIEGGEAHVEGIPLSEPRGLFGGNDDLDDSGILQYVSIRHGGTNIGEGNELNGLTLAGVGSSTQIDHVEVVANADDGIEIFGGTVNLRNIIVAYCGDDAIDYDMGYRGMGQFWLAVQDPAIGDNVVEGDGGVNPVAATPYSIPVVFNTTFIGRGNEIIDHMLNLSDNAGGIFANSIFIRQGNGIMIEYDPLHDDSYRQFQLGNLQVKNNIYHNIANGTASGIFKVTAEPGIDIGEEQQIFQEYFTEAANEVADPGISTEGINFSPFPEGNVYDNLAEYPDPWFDKVNYKGAFGAYDWSEGWSLLSELGLLE